MIWKKKTYRNLHCVVAKKSNKIALREIRIYMTS